MPLPTSFLTPLPDDDLHAYSYAQVAERLGISRSTVERMVRAGHLRAVPVWGRPRVTAAELRRYLDRLQQPLARPTRVRIVAQSQTTHNKR